MDEYINIHKLDFLFLKCCCCWTTFLFPNWNFAGIYLSVRAWLSLSLLLLIFFFALAKIYFQSTLEYCTDREMDDLFMFCCCSVCPMTRNWWQGDQTRADEKHRVTHISRPKNWEYCIHKIIKIQRNARRESTAGGWDWSSTIRHSHVQNKILVLFYFIYDGRDSHNTGWRRFNSNWVSEGVRKSNTAVVLLCSRSHGHFAVFVKHFEEAKTFFFSFRKQTKSFHPLRWNFRDIWRFGSGRFVIRTEPFFSRSTGGNNRRHTNYYRVWGGACRAEDCLSVCLPFFSYDSVGGWRR